ncbi:hypothetical protein QDY63_22900 [Pseudomonas brenneri]|uniref:hypothetical protein n=1 Tax=Pseudomonas brenneri TaxID=129817 RepID=UPI0025A22320|nr:hypothetical protein [Pseudomonas brenneri]WJM90185.1 hypothetical protein QDY63_22900 [Pseudomonas brenneri]
MGCSWHLLIGLSLRHGGVYETRGDSIQGRSSRAVRDVKHQDLIAERQKSAAYRQEVEELKAKLASIASINEVLLDDNQTLKDKLRERNVIELAFSNKRS